MDEVQGAAMSEAGMNVLDRLIGTWALTMQHADQSEPITGRQRYERVLDGAFVLQHWTYDHPDFPDALAMLANDRYHYFDVRGVTRVFDLMIEADGWSMVHLDPDFSQRSTARFRGQDSIEAAGERSLDYGSTWQADFTLTLRRIASDAPVGLGRDSAG